MLRRLLVTAWYVVATLVIGIALLLSVIRLALPMLDDYRLQIQDMLQARTGQHIEIGSLDMAWRGLGPELRLLDVRWSLPGRDDPVLVLGELGVGIDIWEYLENRNILTRWISMRDAELTLVETEDRRWVLAGLENEPVHMNPLALVLSQPRIELEDFNVSLQPQEFGTLPVRRLEKVEAKLLNQGDRHQLNMMVSLPEHHEQPIALAADASGAADDIRHWSGHAYLQGESLVLRDWLSPYLPDRVQVGGLLDLAVWLDVVDGQPQRVMSDIRLDLPDLLTDGEPVPVFAASSMSGLAVWQRSRQGWMLELDRLNLSWPDQTWPETRWSLAVAQGEERDNWNLQLGYLDLKPLQRLLSAPLPLSEPLLTQLRQQQPSARLRDVRLLLESRGDQFSLEHFSAGFENLSVEAWEHYPGASGLSGSLALGQQGGELRLDSRSALAELPGLFRDALPLDTLTGRLTWQRYADRWRLSSENLRLANRDIAVRSRLRLDLPSAGGSPWLDLRATVERGDVAAVKRYLPARVMPERTVEWLDRALLAGAITHGDILFHGRPADYPFPHGEGRFEVLAHVDQGELNYHPDWPGITNITADVGFINQRMHIVSDAARIYSTDLENIVVSIADLKHSRLQVAGQARGDVSEMLQFVRNSPLAERGYPVQGLSGNGGAVLDLDMSIHVSHFDNRPSTVAGRLELQNDTLDLKDWDISLSELTGRVDFTEHGLRAKQVQGELWQTPVELAIEPPAVDGHPTRIKLQGALPLLEQLPERSISQYLQGRAQWLVELGLLRGKPGIDLTLQSDLEGIGVALPEPLGKASEEARSFRLQTRLNGETSRKLWLGYGPHSAALRLDKQNGSYTLGAATLLFNAGGATLVGDDGLHIGGEVRRIAVPEWRAILVKPDEGKVRLPLRSVQLRVAELNYLGQHFRDVALQAQTTDAGWRLTVDSPDASGVVSIPVPLNAGPLEIRMKSLQLATRGNNGKDQRPQDIPDLDFQADKLMYGQFDLGRVRLVTHPYADGLRVDGLKVNSDWITLDATGDWRLKDGREASRFHIEVSGGDLGKLLDNFGYAGNVQGGMTEGTLDANWPGGPRDFSLEKLEGSLALRIGEGTLEKVEPGAGRVFGLLNLQSLRRRLTLDFSDLFSRGFAFDSIVGHFTLIDSDAYTNDLTIEGPSARIEISGRTGLAARDYDQLVTVAPEVSSGLPVAGALAGGPAVGAALFLADKLLGKRLDTLTRYQYTVTGPWESPTFTRLKGDEINLQPGPAPSGEAQ